MAWPEGVGASVQTLFDQPNGLRPHCWPRLQGQGQPREMQAQGVMRHEAWGHTRFMNAALRRHKTDRPQQENAAGSASNIPMGLYGLQP